jgi:hypothetical protein
VGQILRSVPLPPAYEDRLVTTLKTEVYDANCTSLSVTLQSQKVCNFVSGGGKVQSLNVAWRVAGTVLYKGYVEKMWKSKRLFANLMTRPSRNPFPSITATSRLDLDTLLFMAERVVWEVVGQPLWSAHMLKQAKQICQVNRKDTT